MGGVAQRNPAFQCVIICFKMFRFACQIPAFTLWFMSNLANMVLSVFIRFLYNVDEIWTKRRLQLYGFSYTILSCLCFFFHFLHLRDILPLHIFHNNFLSVYIYEKLCYPHHNERHITENANHKIAAVEK